MAVRKCAWCGKDFAAIHSRHQYCCDSCKQLAYLKRVKPSKEPYRRNCIICGKPFTTTVAIKKCCSKECSKARQTMSMKRWQEIHKPEPVESSLATETSIVPVESIAIEYKELPFEMVENFKLFICEKMSCKGTSLPCGDVEACYIKPRCQHIPPGKHRPTGSWKDGTMYRTI